MSGKRHLYAALRRYLAFFLLMAFLITCCLELFLTQFSRATGIVFTEENIRLAAIYTFFNVLWLSLLCTAIDVVRRHYMVERPVRRIEAAARRIMAGDFSARVERTGPAGDFDDVIRYFDRMAEELAGVETLRTDFIANVSHELKTPLAVMQNYGAMLQQPGLTEAERVGYAKAITAASRRLADLVTNILKLDRLENQQIYPDKKTFDLGEQLCQCLVGFENTWEEKGIGIETDIADGVSIRSDPELLSLVWNNLFSNALKFTEPGGTVGLALKQEGDLAVVTVYDTGCGIAPEVGKHIFEKFYQGDASHAAQGNGLGLALVKRVVDIMGGEIAVESEVGRGSTFTVRLRRGNDDA